MEEVQFKGSEAVKSAEKSTALTPEAALSSATRDRKGFQLPENQSAQGALPSLELDFAAGSTASAAAPGAGAEARSAQRECDTSPPAAKSAASPELDHHPMAALMGDALSKLTGPDSKTDSSTRLRQIAEQALKASDLEGGKFELVTSRNSEGNHQIVLRDASGDRAGMIARSGNFVAIDDGKDLTLVSLNGTGEADGSIKFDREGKPQFAALKDGDSIPFKSPREYADLAHELTQLSQRYGPMGSRDVFNERDQEEEEQKALSPIAAHLKNAGEELGEVARKMSGTEQLPGRNRLENSLREFRFMNADDFVAKKAEQILDLPMQTLQEQHENGELRQALADHYLATGQYDKATPHFQHLVDYAPKPGGEDYDSITARNDANSMKLEMTNRAVSGRPPAPEALTDVIKQGHAHFSSTDRFAPKEPES